MRRAAQILVVLSALFTAVAPLFGGWFGVGPLKEYHVLNPAWDDHAKFHLMWQGFVTGTLGLVTIVAGLTVWSHGRAVRWLIAAVPIVTMLGYLASFYLFCSMLGISEPVVHVQSRILGFRSNILGIDVVLLFAVAGMTLDWLADRREAAGSPKLEAQPAE
jgi:hypothetical protein